MIFNFSLYLALRAGSSIFFLPLHTSGVILGVRHMNCKTNTWVNFHAIYCMSITSMALNCFKSLQWVMGVEHKFNDQLIANFHAILSIDYAMSVCLNTRIWGILVGCSDLSILWRTMGSRSFVDFLQNFVIQTDRQTDKQTVCSFISIYLTVF